MDYDTIPFWYDADEYSPQLVIRMEPNEPIYLVEENGKIYIKKMSTIFQEELDASKE